MQLFPPEPVLGKYLATKGDNAGKFLYICAVDKHESGFWTFDTYNPDEFFTNDLFDCDDWGSISKDDGLTFECELPDAFLFESRFLRDNNVSSIEYNSFLNGSERFTNFDTIPKIGKYKPSSSNNSTKEIFVFDVIVIESEESDDNEEIPLQFDVAICSIKDSSLYLVREEFFWLTSAFLKLSFIDGFSPSEKSEISKIIESDNMTTPKLN